MNTEPRRVQPVYKPRNAYQWRNFLFSSPETPVAWKREDARHNGRKANWRR